MLRSRFFQGWAFFAVLSVAWTVFAGKDLNWDFLNYHLYGPYELLSPHRSGDYFAASIQSYLNPTGYIPLYWMVASNWPPIVIAAILAIIHSFAFLLLWKITECILPSEFRRTHIACFIAVALSFLAPLQLATIGGSFLDPITAVPILAAVLLTVSNIGQIGIKYALIIGFAGGAAAGLKLTNLLVAPALFVALQWAAGNASLSRLGVRAVAFGLAFIGGFLLMHGYWSLHLWKEFGNPIFPLFNGIFQSPDFLETSFQDRRFMSAGWVAFLTLPFEMTAHSSWIYSESVSPDVRPLILILALGGLGVHSLLSGRSERSQSNSRGYQVVLLFAFVFYLTWMQASRIGRYAHVLWLLVGPLLVATLARLKWQTAAATIVTLTICVQTLFVYETGNPRWTPLKWGNSWLDDVSVPSELREHPYSYLTFSSQTYSALFPQFHPRSRFANITGQYMQPVGERMTDRLRSFLEEGEPSLKAMFTVRDLANGQIKETAEADVNATLSLYGLQLASRQCHEVTFNTSRFRGYIGSSTVDIKHVFAVCDVTRLPALQTSLALVELARIDQVLNAIEDRCGQLLSPPRVQTMKGGKGWMRTYFNSNSQLITDGNIVLIRKPSEINDIPLGRFEDWRKGSSSASCGLAVQSDD